MGQGRAVVGEAAKAEEEDELGVAEAEGEDWWGCTKRHWCAWLPWRRGGGQAGGRQVSGRVWRRLRIVPTSGTEMRIVRTSGTEMRIVLTTSYRRKAKMRIVRASGFSKLSPPNENADSPNDESRPFGLS